MRVVRPNAKRSISISLALLLAMCATLLLASEGLVRSEIRGIKNRTSIMLGLSEVKYSGRVLLSHLGRIPSAVADGQFPSKIEPLYIDVKFANLQVIREDRLRALEHNILVDHREVRAIVRHDGQVYRANIRLKGDFPGHWVDENRWSLRVELKDGAAIWGMSEFSLHKPRERIYPFDQTFQEIIRHTGNLSPRQTLFRVTLNGDDWGVMNVEEQVSREMVELQRRKDSVIAKFGNPENRWRFEKLNEGAQLPYARYGTLREMQPFDEKRVYADAHLHRLYSYLNTAILKYADGQLAYEDVFDVDSYSRALLAAIVWNNVHTLGFANSRHYLNPYTLRLEPITTDQRKSLPFSVRPPNRFSVTHSGTLTPGITPEPYIDLFLTDTFWQRLQTNLAVVLDAFTFVQPVYERLQAFFPLEQLQNPASITAENLSFFRDEGESFLHELADRVRAREDSGLGFSTNPAQIAAFRGTYPQHLIARHYADGTLEIENLLLEPVTLLNVTRSLGKIRENLGVDRQVIPPSTADTPSVVRLTVPISQLQSEERLSIESEIYGQRRSIELRGTIQTGLRNPLLDERDIASLLDSHPFFAYDGGSLRIKSGTWTINEPIVLSDGVALSIDAGTTLDFCSDCYLIVKAPVQLKGTATAPIRLQPRDEQWKGLYVLEAGQNSTLEHTEIIGTTEIADSALALTGGVVFYRSDVSMQNVHIRNARGEDALNIVESDFFLRNVEICDARSDGFDADFSDGRILDVLFCDIGGDALDMSGSEIYAENFRARGIHDKAISAGERTKFSLVGADIERVGTGIVAKDSSVVQASDVTVRSYALYAAMAYQKKAFFGPGASLTLSKMMVDADTSPYLAQTGNELRVDNYVIPTTDLNIDALYASGPMKK